MRALITITAVVCLLAQCTGDRRETVAQNGPWELSRVPRSNAGGRTQYHYDLTYNGRTVAVAGDLTTPVGTLTMAARTDQYSDSGWLLDHDGRRPVPTIPPPLSTEEARRGYYKTNGRYRREATPSDWVFQWFEPNEGVWMKPDRMFDPAVARTRPPSTNTL